MRLHRHRAHRDRRQSADRAPMQTGRHGTGGTATLSARPPSMPNYRPHHETAQLSQKNRPLRKVKQNINVRISMFVSIYVSHVYFDFASCSKLGFNN
jgi:hypothetical protein